MCLFACLMACKQRIHQQDSHLPNKEMDAVWNMNTIVDRKRWGVGGLADLDSLSCHPL